MPNLWQTVVTYLGLGPDSAYDEYESSPSEPQRPARAARPAGRAAGSRGGPGGGPPMRRDDMLPDVEQSAVRVVPAGGGNRPAPRPNGDRAPVARSGVRPIPQRPKSAKPKRVSPSTFNEAQKVGDAFKAGQPVILNLEGVDRDVARRILDFASGACYGLGGSLEKVANGVYLMTPADVEVSVEDRRRITAGRGD